MPMFFEAAGREPSDAERAQATQTRENLRFKPEEILNETQSRSILLVYSCCVHMGCSPEAAVVATADTFRIGEQKVYNVSAAVNRRTPALCRTVYCNWYIHAYSSCSTCGILLLWCCHRLLFSIPVAWVGACDAHTPGTYAHIQHQFALRAAVLLRAQQYT